MKRFAGKVVLVSGATRGIGKAIASAFIEEDATLVGLYAGNEESAAAFMAEHQQAQGRIDLCRCNVADPQQVAELFEHLETRHQRLDILVNNAGVRRDAVLAMMHDSQWQEVIDTNLTGTFLMARKAVPLMMRNKFGRIVNITSPVARLGFAGQANYAASKAGQIALARSLAREVARKKITEVLDRLKVKHKHATNGAEAWTRLQGLAAHAQQTGVNLRDDVRLILVDAEMPEMDGYVLTKSIKADSRFDGIPVVMHSSLSSEANRAMGQAVGVDAYVAKFDAEVLADTLRPILER